jgi:3-hydroxyacyl-CoA dehydrogenase
MREMGLTVEEVDALTVPAMGRPKTATFRLADLVGLDTFLHVAANVYENAPDDESRDLFVPPDFLTKMVAKGLLGRKSGAGFYKKLKGPTKGRADVNLNTLSTAGKEGVLPAGALKSIEDPVERLKKLVFRKGRAGEAAWKMLAPSLSYAAMRVGEICDDLSAVDRAVRWGFNWTLGPFEIWMPRLPAT